MRDKNGFLNISHYTDLGATQDGESVPHWLSNENNKYVFKVINGIRLYRELLYPIILRNINVNAVYNDLATFNGNKGILSKCFYSKEEKVVSFSSLIKQYCKDVLNAKYYQKVSSLHNIGDLNTIFKWYSFIHNLNYDEQVTKTGLLQDFILQILLANDDNVPINRAAYVSNDFNLSPYFDFEYYGDINLRRDVKQIGSYHLDFYADRSKERPKTYIETIEHFKYYATKEEMETFLSYLEQLQTLKINDQFEELETQIHTHIPTLKKLKLKRDYESNLKNVSALINDKK